MRDRYRKLRTCFIFFCSLFFVLISGFYLHGNSEEKYSYSEVFTIGIDQPIDKFPIAWKRIIYQVNGSRFLKLGELEDSEGIYIGTVSKNRLILYSNEPYGRVRVLDFKKY